jgi:hypothetical protein
MTNEQRKELIGLTGTPPQLWINGCGTSYQWWEGSPGGVRIPLEVGDLALMEHARAWADERGYYVVPHMDAGKWYVYSRETGLVNLLGLKTGVAVFDDYVQALVAACRLAKEPT